MVLIQWFIVFILLQRVMVSFWYSFDVGTIHIVYYSTEHSFRRQSAQYAWTEKDLRSVNRSRTP